MIPRNMNQKSMKLMMKRMGINTEEMPNVEEVVIITADKELHISSPQVTLVEAQGVKTYTVVGEAKEVPRKKELFTKEDIEIVMNNAHVSEESAIAALKECNGMPADAIDKLLHNKTP